MNVGISVNSYDEEIKKKQMIIFKKVLLTNQIFKIMLNSYLDLFPKKCLIHLSILYFLIYKKNTLQASHLAMGTPRMSS